MVELPLRIFGGFSSKNISLRKVAALYPCTVHYMIPVLFYYCICDLSFSFMVSHSRIWRDSQISGEEGKRRVADRHIKDRALG